MSEQDSHGFLAAEGLDDLQFLVHFFNDRRYLFKTITMAAGSQVDEICDTISSHLGWFWMRFSPGERQGYLTRRRFVEQALYEDYTRDYGSLKERVPVFFYLVPNITEQQALESARQRMRHGETEPQVAMVRIADIEDTTNITFTLNDSHAAYWQRIKEAGLGFGGEATVPVSLPDHNRVFPFSMIGQLHQTYRTQGLKYEIQVWDYQVLERMKYTILSSEGEGGRESRTEGIPHYR
jgi:hypothetical protein